MVNRKFLPLALTKAQQTQLADWLSKKGNAYTKAWVFLAEVLGRQVSWRQALTELSFDGKVDITRYIEQHGSKIKRRLE